MNVAQAAPRGPHYHAEGGCLNLAISSRATNIMNSWGIVQHARCNRQLGSVLGRMTDGYLSNAGSYSA